ncbi:hypothetical protein AVEN_202226-1 [Araneus ventricosus]|uniref:Uncharacterized protein n=1 Tax=Araneus ventricosus TaxID=182803 RepID=A0A4Y2SHV8_ARAVE|nr:hypothetical protein AVEN_202226-1 [Araneus ventricosus]
MKCSIFLPLFGWFQKLIVPVEFCRVTLKRKYRWITKLIGWMKYLVLSLNFGEHLVRSDCPLREVAFWLMRYQLGFFALDIIEGGERTLREARELMVPGEDDFSS